MPFDQTHSAPTASPAFDIPDHLIGQLITQAHDAIEEQTPGTFGAPLVGGPIDWSRAKTLLKIMFPYVLGMLKIAYPGIPVDQIVDILTKKINDFEPAPHAV